MAKRHKACAASASLLNMAASRRRLTIKTKRVALIGMQANLKQYDEMTAVGEYMLLAKSGISHKFSNIDK